MLPYKTLDNRIDGAVLVLVDIDALMTGNVSRQQVGHNVIRSNKRAARELNPPNPSTLTMLTLLTRLLLGFADRIP